jgi:glycerol-3-phosphate cytidylyltransferase
MSTIGVLGAGTWGIALARMLTNCGHDVVVWSAIESEIDELSNTRKHKNLPGMEIPQETKFTKSIEEVCSGKDILLFAVPSVFVRSAARKSNPYVRANQIIVDVAIGIEPETLLTLTQVIQDELDNPVHLVTLSGPTHAQEVARDVPTMIVSACTDLEIARRVQDLFMNSCLRVYTNPDVEGVELCGAVKNIIELSTGIAAGLGCGDNMKAALITRGMAEVSRLGKAMGCYEQTFSGLAGMGELIVTATSEHSRNNRCGKLIGQGIKPEEAVKQIGMVVEGINALPAILQLAERYHVSMPITEAVDEIVNGEQSPKDVMAELMSREKRSEISTTVNYEHALLQKGRETGMKRVITYGTYDLLHYGHINLLRRAKALGDYLIVVLSSDEFNWKEKHKKTYFTYEQRKQLLESIRYVDLVIPETNWQQKRTDMHEYHIDTFVMGDDWKGKFDFLKEEGVGVVYLPRTPEISSSQMKKDLHDADQGESKITHDDIDTDPQ